MAAAPANAPLIRPESPADVAAIHAVTVAAFLDAPHADHTEQFVVAALREAGALTVSLVAEVRSAVVGHVAVSPVVISDGATGWLGLGPISIHPDFKRRGFGSLLMRGALGRLRELGAAGCVLLGDPAYYARFGFRPEPGLVPPDVPPECFQTLSFRPPLPQGVVTYRAAFSARG